MIKEKGNDLVSVVTSLYTVDKIGAFENLEHCLPS